MAQDPMDELAAWLDDNWNPALTVGEWWQLLADSGYAKPSLPEHAHGKGWSQSQETQAMRLMASKDVLGPPPGLGYMLAAPTIAAHGSQEQIDRYIPKILNGEEAWCQLFSEPAAGSDLAGLQTKAERDGDQWRVEGQKVWTSQGHAADLGMLVARTDPSQPKHRGLTYFVMDMHQDGVDVRPLKEMTGRTFFSEVFMTDAWVNEADRIGDHGDGWRVANTTLTVERTSIGTGSTGVAMAAPGQRMSNFGRVAGEVVQRSKESRAEGHAPGVGMKLFDRYVQLGRKLGTLEDPSLRDDVMKLYSMLQVNRLNMLRARVKNQRTGGEPNIAKLWNGEHHRQFRDLGMRIVGADGMLAATASMTDPAVVNVALNAQAPPIYGGTDQIQKNILGERVLGLPKEPGFDRDTPFTELPKNQ
ncbi:MAG: acyl-CoA dehydrogenase family protein [Actinomycetota bacterium]